MLETILRRSRHGACHGWLLVSLLALTACKPAPEAEPGAAADPGGSPPAAEETPTMPDPIMTSELAGAWRLLALGDDDSPAAMESPVTLEFTTEGVGGHSGVNRYRMTVQVDSTRGTISFGTGMSTLMAGPPEAMDVERRYLAALGEVDRYLVKDGRLQLLAGDEVRLQFESVEDASS